MNSIFMNQQYILNNQSLNRNKKVYTFSFFLTLPVSYIKNCLVVTHLYINKNTVKNKVMYRWLDESVVTRGSQESKPVFPLELGEMSSRDTKDSALGSYLLVEWKLRTFLTAMSLEKKACR